MAPLRYTFLDESELPIKQILDDEECDKFNGELEPCTKLKASFLITHLSDADHSRHNNLGGRSNQVQRKTSIIWGVSS